MIKRKKKICLNCNEEKFIFGKGLCDKCYRIQLKPIKKISEKQKSIVSEYKIVRAEFLKSNPLCRARLEECTVIATDVHHLIGKSNREKYIDSRYFMPLCRSCHEKIERGGSWVYEMGFKLRRI